MKQPLIAALLILSTAQAAETQAARDAQLRSILIADSKRMGVSCAPTQVSSVTSIKTTPAKAGTELEDGKKRLWEKLDAATRQLVIHLEEDDKKT